jgi:hypothetical protein
VNVIGALKFGGKRLSFPLESCFNAPNCQGLARMILHLRTRNGGLAKAAIEGME